MSGRTNSQAQADAFAAWHEQEGIRVSRELLSKTAALVHMLWSSTASILTFMSLELAEGMLPVIGRLYRRNNVVVTLCQGTECDSYNYPCANDVH